MERYTEVTELRLKAQRKRFVDDLLKALDAIEGVKLTRLVWLDKRGNFAAPKGNWHECRLAFAVPGVLEVSLAVSKDWPTPLLSWFGAVRPLRGVIGAWAGADVNRFHRRKATSYPYTLNQTIAMLVTGFKAALDGSAFEDVM